MFVNVHTVERAYNRTNTHTLVYTHIQVQQILIKPIEKQNKVDKKKKKKMKRKKTLEKWKKNEAEEEEASALATCNSNQYIGLSSGFSNT